MKGLSFLLQSHLEGEVTSLAQCWKVTRRDGVVLGFTDTDADLLIDGVLYTARSGFSPSAVASHANLAVDNLDLIGLLDDDALRAEDIEAGLYDFAEVEIFWVNYRALEQGRLPIRQGWLGEVRLAGGQFTAEIRGLSQKLSQVTGELYSPTCRALLGDARCKVDKTAYTISGVLDAQDSAATVKDAARTELPGTFAYGLLTMHAGRNAGLSREVKDSQPGELRLLLPFPYPLVEGEAYSLSRGCDKRFSTCVERFGNAVNFRGEPHVPGLDRMLETAATRSR